MKRKSEEMLSEYDFAGKKGIRGKYAKAYKTGHSVRIYDGDEVVISEYFAAIDPDVRQFFPDSSSINKALRKLISLFPKEARSRRQ